jgi:hypothetical protein
MIRREAEMLSDSRDIPVNRPCVLEQRDAIVDLIAYEPTRGDIIPGSGGLRKIRIGRDGIGKRGGARVIYYFYNERFPILLVALYAKNEKNDLTAAKKRELAASIKVKVTQWQKK